MKKVIYLIIGLITYKSLTSQTTYFPPLTGNSWDTISPMRLGYCQDKIDSLYNFLDNQNTKAFILLKDGKIVLEKYFNSQTQSSLWQWASAGKTITSFLVGIAQQEGDLSILDSTSAYLGNGWTNCTLPRENKITIKHQLSMTTGLDDGVTDNYCTLDTCLLYKADAGKRWAYHNAPYTLLGDVLEQATGQTLNNYVAQKLKTPIGMNGLYINSGYNNVYFSNARSMARFGLLILNKGVWNGNKIMTDSNYFHQMVNSSQTHNPSYGYLWWLNGKSSYMVPGYQLSFPGTLFSNAPSDMISALGKDGQFLNVIPSQNIVWLRMGESPDNSQVPFLLNNDIAKYVSKLACVSSLSKLNYATTDLVKLYPNPSRENVLIKAKEKIVQICIYNMQGQLVKTQNASEYEVDIFTQELKNGFYIVKATLQNGQVWSGKLLKH